MNYFITGATGFIGKRLVRKILGRDGAKIYFLAYDASPATLKSLYRYWGADETRVIAVAGDITAPGLGIAEDDQAKLAADAIEHFFHLAAVYDLRAGAQVQQAANVGGTRNAVAFARDIGAGRFHHMSSIASAGLYEGVFREDMFDEAEHLDHPYFSTKHESERIVRTECTLPWRIYRPGLVVGDSATGEMDKIDGPYYFFKLIQRTRQLLPPWMPSIGIEGGRINLVPVDFVVNAIDYIAHAPGLDGKCFHLVDPKPMRVGEVLNAFAKAAHAPAMSLFINAALFGFVPANIKQGMMQLTPVRRIRNAVMKDLDLPEDIMTFVNYPTRFDCRQAQQALEGSGIAAPRLDTYAWRLWDYWERNLDPDLQIDRTLKGKVKGRVVLITGGSSGIGLAAAKKIAAAGATVLIVARDPEKLARAKTEIAALGTVHSYQADLTDEAQCAAFVARVLKEHGGVDILVNSAGRSIRRAIEASYERFHDFERTMQINYFAALRLTLALLPFMVRQQRGHVINISSIGVLTNAPRFSAYIASKAALEAFTRCAGSEYADAGIKFTTINMPLVKTPMIAPTRIYDSVPLLAPEEAADMIADAIVKGQVRVATRLGILGELVHALMPRVGQIIMNTSFRMFPESAAAAGKREGEEPPHTADQIAFAQLMRGIHF